MMKCVQCGKEHQPWRSGMTTGSICPKCWADLRRKQRRERYEAFIASKMDKLYSGF